ncbi:hypothetical protein TGAM01_v205838 [Trichoderma gamsii]|uniref:Uncharacterized protein n=1 Tax=Trichoderma gamsii TaxID=398673 RepID=A0A2P4ZLI8_9HYPO|nr:hypothetical protein TGAM01_v205838 [Trichoderma gamsii]PON25152.1 hypothetical protein TGAM01_v205838 [Trichoderma gamsii]
MCATPYTTDLGSQPYSCPCQRLSSPLNTNPFTCALNSFKSLQFPVARLRRLQLPMPSPLLALQLHPAFLTPRGKMDFN